ncbi:UNVERIFIED_CONTAM: hypothetical protein HDU68_011933 [Siphonaria sp. JEL0065]|nr:hypothetical protein HDU68_011933 [Siphonaria sp. JEL0065]
MEIPPRLSVTMPTRLGTAMSRSLSHSSTLLSLGRSLSQSQTQSNGIVTKTQTASKSTKAVPMQRSKTGAFSKSGLKPQIVAWPTALKRPIAVAAPPLSPRLIDLPPVSFPGTLPLSPKVPVHVSNGTTIVMASTPFAKSKTIASMPVPTPAPTPAPIPTARSGSESGKTGSDSAAVLSTAIPAFVVFAAVAKSLLDSQDYIAVDGVVYSKDDIIKLEKHCAAMDSDIKAFMELMAKPIPSKRITKKKKKSKKEKQQIVESSLLTAASIQVGRFGGLFKLPLTLVKTETELIRVLEPLKLDFEFKSLLMEVLSERKITVNHLSGLMVLINNLLSSIQSLVTATSKAILPDSLRDELKFLYSYVKFCINSGEAHTLPYLFPNEYQVSSCTTSEITAINVSTTVLLLRSIARVSAKIAIYFLSSSSSASNTSTPVTSPIAASPSSTTSSMTRSSPTSVLFPGSPQTSPYGLIYTPPTKNGTLAHKRAMGLPDASAFASVSPELLLMEGGDQSIDLSNVQDVGDLSGEIGFMSLDVDAEEAKLWQDGHGEGMTTSGGSSENGDEESEAGTVVGWSASSLAMRRLSLEKAEESGDSESEGVVGAAAGGRQSSETLGEDVEWEAFRVREIGIPEHILRLEFEAMLLARAEGREAEEKEDELNFW